MGHEVRDMSRGQPERIGGTTTEVLEPPPRFGVALPEKETGGSPVGAT